MTLRFFCASNSRVFWPVFFLEAEDPLCALIELEPQPVKIEIAPAELPVIQDSLPLASQLAERREDLLLEGRAVIDLGLDAGRGDEPVRCAPSPKYLRCRSSASKLNTNLFISDIPRNFLDGRQRILEADTLGASLRQEAVDAVDLSEGQVDPGIAPFDIGPDVDHVLGLLIVESHSRILAALDWYFSETRSGISRLTLESTSMHG